MKTYWGMVVVVVVGIACWVPVIKYVVAPALREVAGMIG